MSERKFESAVITFFVILVAAVTIFSTFSLPPLKANNIAEKIHQTSKSSHFRSNNIDMNLSTNFGSKVIPPLLYGTAWKKERTQPLVKLAIQTGFRGIDTACQPKHYYEPGVGAALLELYKENSITRSDVFLQTKFTSFDGQDPNNIPYDKNAPLEEQVKTSLQTSLKNLHTDYLDSLILHSPLNTFEDTMIVWRTFESFVNEGKVHHLGISNIYNLSLLQKIYEHAIIKPKFIQNRFYAESGYDVDIRDYCKQHNMIYQSFWTLSANPHIIRSQLFHDLAKKYNKTKEQIFFAYVKSLGITFLSGTANPDHMMEDLHIAHTGVAFTPEEIQAIQSLF